MTKLYKGEERENSADIGDRNIILSPPPPQTKIISNLKGLKALFWFGSTT
jgi:hypothetical protein